MNTEEILDVDRIVLSEVDHSNGCFIHPDCFTCPLRDCVHVLRGPRGGPLNLSVVKAQIDAYKLWEEGLNFDDISQVLGLRKQWRAPSRKVRRMERMITKGAWLLGATVTRPFG